MKAKFNGKMTPEQVKETLLPELLEKVEDTINNFAEQIDMTFEKWFDRTTERYEEDIARISEEFHNALHNTHNTTTNKEEK